jgi:hypothetical protein
LRAEIEALRAHRPLADIEQSMHQSILPPDPPPLPPPAAPSGGPGNVTDQTANMDAAVPEPPRP